MAHFKKKTYIGISKLRSPSVLKGTTGLRHWKKSIEKGCASKCCNLPRNHARQNWYICNDGSGDDCVAVILRRRCTGCRQYSSRHRLQTQNPDKMLQSLEEKMYNCQRCFHFLVSLQFEVTLLKQEYRWVVF